MKPDDIKNFIKTVAKNQVFTVTFTKKDNSKRVMNCRLGVKKHLHGGVQPYNPADHDLLTVFDMQKGDYRNINLDKIIDIKIGGVDITFQPKVNKNTKSKSKSRVK